MQQLMRIHERNRHLLSDPLFCGGREGNIRKPHLCVDSVSKMQRKLTSRIRLVQPLHYTGFFSRSICSSHPACSAASLFPASSAAPFASRIRLVQPLHYPGFFSRAICSSYPACSAASLSRLLQPFRLHLVSGLFSRFIPASSAAQFAPRIRLVQPLHYSGFFSRSVRHNSVCHNLDCCN